MSDDAVSPEQQAARALLSLALLPGITKAGYLADFTDAPAWQVYGVAVVVAAIGGAVEAGRGHWWIGAPLGCVGAVGATFTVAQALAALKLSSVSTVVIVLLGAAGASPAIGLAVLLKEHFPRPRRPWFP